MTELKKLLHADPEAETYVYEIEQTAEHLTVARLTRDAGGDGWRYAMTAQHVGEPPSRGPAAPTEVRGEGHGFATVDDALAAARDHARLLLAGGPQAIGLTAASVAPEAGAAPDDPVTAAIVGDPGRGHIDKGWIDDRPVEGGSDAAAGDTGDGAATGRATPGATP